MEQSSASIPCALSFIFKPCLQADIIKSGSIGVGCTIDKKVDVTVKKQISSKKKTEIFFNGKNIHFPTVLWVVQQMTPLPMHIEIQSPLPLGCGCGISGASALATAYALNTFHMGETHVPTQVGDLASLQKIAHTSEIMHKTGLGTVATQITGGFLLKSSPGIPVSFTRFPWGGVPLYITLLDRMETPGILSVPSMMERVCVAADHALYTIKQCSHSLTKRGSEGVGSMLDISYKFILESQLPIDKKTKEVIKSIRGQGGSATMAILGQTVISTIPPKGSHYQVKKVTITHPTHHPQQTTYLVL